MTNIVPGAHFCIFTGYHGEGSIGVVEEEREGNPFGSGERYILTKWRRWVKYHIICDKNSPSSIILL